MLLLWDGANAHSSTVLNIIKKQKVFTLISGANIFSVYKDPPHTPFFFFPIVFLGFFVLVLPINAYHSLKQLDSEAQE